MNILDKIIANKQLEIEQHKKEISLFELEQTISRIPTSSRSFRQALLNSDSGIISEFKRKSPSKGWIFPDAKVEEVIPAYTQAGASAISVLTDELFFGGSFADFLVARKCTDIPLLRKDFMVDEYQLYQAKALGADVILLIAAALEPIRTKQLAACAHGLGLEVLLEIHHEKELEHIHPNIDVVGINNRDLTTFVTDIQTSFRLGEQIPEEYVRISESGISDREVILQLRESGFRGFLVGESLMKTGNPGDALKKLIIK